MARHRNKIGIASVKVIATFAVAILAAACTPDLANRAKSLPAVDGLPTIVSLNPCIDAILVEIAAPAQVLALSHYSRDPGSSSIPAHVAARFGVTGGTAEEVIALAPDVVLASTFLPQPTRRALERAGLQVKTFGSPVSVAQSIAQVQQVATVAGVRRRGEALAAQIAVPPPPLTGLPVSALLWQPGEIVAGEATVIAELLRQEGFASHAAARGLGQADMVTLETLLADPPRVLLIAGNALGQRHPLIRAQSNAQSKAQFKSMQIAPFDPALLYCGGPTIPKARARLRAIRAEAEAAP